MVHLFPKWRMAELRKWPTPEILSKSLEEVVMQQSRGVTNVTRAKIEASFLRGNIVKITSQESVSFRKRTYRGRGLGEDLARCGMGPLRKQVETEEI